MKTLRGMSDQQLRTEQKRVEHLLDLLERSPRYKAGDIGAIELADHYIARLNDIERELDKRQICSEDIA